MNAYTEAQAKEKWRPHASTAIVAGALGVAGNRDENGNPRPSCFCIASACMAWQDLGKHTCSPESERIGRCGLANF